MSERKFQDSSRTQQLKSAFDILKRQGDCRGGWYHGEHVTAPLCVEGALQKVMIGVSPKHLYQQDTYKFLFQEAVAKGNEWGKVGKFWSKIPKIFWPAELQMRAFHASRLDIEAFPQLNLYNDYLGKTFIFPLMEKAIAKSEAMDRKEF